MSKKNIGIGIIIVVIIGGGSFYGGMKYAQASLANRAGGQFRQFTAGAGAVGGNARFVNANGAGDLSAGDIVSVSPTSLSLSMRDGSSKVVFYSDATSIQKYASGSSADLKTGVQITVMGSPNSDGSITAQSIQIRPDAPAAQGTVQTSTQ